MDELARWLSGNRVEDLVDPLALTGGRMYLDPSRCMELIVGHRGAIRAKIYGHGRHYAVTARAHKGELVSACSCSFKGAMCRHVACALLAREAALREAGELGAPSGDVARLRPETSRDDLFAWAQARGMSHWLNASVAVVPTLASPSSPEVDFERRRNLPIAEFFGRESRWSHLPRAFAEDLAAFLEERATRVAAWRAASRERAWPEPRPELAEAVAQVLAARQERLESTGGIEPEARVSPELVVDRGAWPVELHVELPRHPTAACPHYAGVWTNHQIRLVFDGDALRILGTSDSDDVVLTALEAALDDLCQPEPTPVADALAAELAMPLWERLLGTMRSALRQAADAPLRHGDDEGELGWRVRVSAYELALAPLFVRPKKTGEGFVTRKLALATVVSADRRWPLVADARVIEELAADDARSHYRAVRHLVGHPRVFLDAPGSPRVTARAYVLTHAAWPAGDDDDQRGVALGFELARASHGGGSRHAERLTQEGAEALINAARLRTMVVANEAEDELRVITVPPEAEGIARALRRFGEVLPDEAVPALVDYLTDASEVAEVSVPDSLSGERVEAACAPTLQLDAPPDAPVVARIVVQPLPERATELPGFGPQRLIARRGEVVIHCVRDFEMERAAARAMAAQLGLDGVGAAEEGEGGALPFEWGFDAVDDVLDVLSRAREADVPVAWATGTRYAVRRRIEGADLVVRAEGGSGRDWFGLDGEVTVDGTAVPLRDLLRALRERRRYVQVADGEWAALDAALRRRLETLAAVTSGERVSVLAAPVVAELAELGADVSGTGAWLDRVDRAREASELHVELPEGLIAELRTYQREGVVWLGRLAHWATGACLADDMGLGKTVQALALMLRRSGDGPQLVVAPTSLGFNWQREAASFAPALELIPFRGAGQVELFEQDLGPGQVIVTSYDLVARYSDAFAARRWQTVVLDEAQAIKNPDTLRAKAVFGLDADFVLALTGTPIENRTAELWSLFRAIAPGLLGGRKAFRDRFAIPIERTGDPQAREALAALVRPFVLRRLKRDVARELPARSDVRLDVELSAAERALYDEVRDATVASMAQVDEKQPGARFMVLQALTRLRQLACHPALVDPQSPVASSKLEVVRELVAELRDEGHRALVFSQFTTLLGLVRAALEADGVSCRYLDGSTPAAKRREEVDAFQEGEGDVFLLSLKAGGTGLNLTAADYVLHLDPWWNPAVEDQATDRAHRIGQDKPVTVYRLVAQGTVEEGIMALHEERRELAEALLAGTDSARSLSVEELGALIRAGQSS